MSDISGWSAISEAAALRAHLKEGTPLPSWYDRFTTDLVPDGVNTGSSNAEGLRKSWVAANDFYAKVPHLAISKLAVRTAHTQLRDSRYSRIGRCALEQQAVRTHATLVARETERLLTVYTPEVSKMLKSSGMELNTKDVFHAES